MSTLPDWEPVVLPQARSRLWRAGSNGQQYRVSLWLPAGTPPPGGFPVVCVLDANAMFASFTEAVARMSRRTDATGILPTAVIGIAHDEADLYVDALRRRDYTNGPQGGGVAHGGADAFLSFIVDELLPALEAEAPLSPSRRTLFGHSLGGFFALHALASRPADFGLFAAISPSVWWDEASVHERLSRLDHPTVRSFLCVGEWEGEVPPWQRSAPGHAELVERRAQRRMLANTESVAALLRERLGEARAAFHLFPGEDHASVVMIATQRVLRFASAPGLTA
ncbi:alpha/beta hydrolase [Uliginosibacterium sp. H1]|uniref:alpha/beta hydrolase n=1 Tax=Uliginosibacterium sp. H1 TaxID=3114757 RepID=UPI002E194FBD|nr:alpha/beta hydrolase-fold protein [Uliginosibacterium sp. H1]